MRTRVELTATPPAQMLTLEHAFQARDISALLVKITAGRFPEPPLSFDRAVREAVHAMLQTRPERRWSCYETLVSPVFRPHLAKYARGARQDLLDALRRHAPRPDRHPMVPQPDQPAESAAGAPLLQPTTEGPKRAKTDPILPQPRPRHLPVPPLPPVRPRRLSEPQAQAPQTCCAATPEPASPEAAQAVASPERTAKAIEEDNHASLHRALLFEAPPSPQPVLLAVPRPLGGGHGAVLAVPRSDGEEAVKDKDPPPVLIMHCQSRNLPRPSPRRHGRRAWFSSPQRPDRNDDGIAHPAFAAPCVSIVTGPPAPTQTAPEQAPSTTPQLATDAGSAVDDEAELHSPGMLGDGGDGDGANNNSAHCWVLVSVALDGSEEGRVVDHEMHLLESCPVAATSPSQVSMLEPTDSFGAKTGASQDGPGAAGEAHPNTDEAAGCAAGEQPGVQVTSKFLLAGATLKLGATTNATPFSRLEALRSFLEARLGDDLCVQVYQHIEDLVGDKDVDATLSSLRLALGPEHGVYLPLVLQLVHAERYHAHQL